VQILDIKHPARGLMSNINPEIAQADFAVRLQQLVPDGGTLKRYEELAPLNNSIAAPVNLAGAFFDRDDNWIPWAVYGSTLYRGSWASSTRTITWTNMGSIGISPTSYLAFNGAVRFSDGTYSKILINIPAVTRFGGQALTSGWKILDTKLSSPVVENASLPPSGGIAFQVSEITDSDTYFQEGDKVEFGFTYHRTDGVSYLSRSLATTTISANGKSLSLNLHADGNVDDRVVWIGVWIKVNDGVWQLWRKIHRSDNVVDDSNSARAWSWDTINNKGDINGMVIDGSPLTDEYTALTGYSDDDINTYDATGILVGTEVYPYVPWGVAIPAGGRAIYAGVTVDGELRNDRIYVSYANQPDIVPETNYFDIGIDDGDSIVALAYVPGRLYVFKTNNIYVISAASYDPVGWRVVSRIKGLGVDDYRKIITRADQVFFANSSGVFLLYGDQLKRIDLAWADKYEQWVPDPVLGIYEENGDLLVGQSAGYSYFFAIALTSRTGREPLSAVQLFGPGGTIDDAYWLPGPDGNAYFMFINSSAGDSTVYSFSSGATKSIEWETPSLDLGRAYVRGVRLVGSKLGGLDLKVRLDGVINASMSTTLDSSLDKTAFVRFAGKGRRVAIYLSGSADQDFELEKAELWIEPLPRELPD